MMKSIRDFLFSTRLIAIVMAVFAVSIATATFIENDFGSATARTLVYNARWFEVLLLLGAVNLAGNIFIKRLYRKEKFTIFLFHFAFLVILAGACITRYTGFEGSMSIREGEKSRTLITSQPCIVVTTVRGDETLRRSFPVSFSMLGRNKLEKSFQFADKSFHLSVLSYYPNAYPTIETSPDGKPVAEIIFSDHQGRKSQVITSGESKKLGNLMFSLDVAEPDTQGIVLVSSGDSLLFSSPCPVSRSGMSDRNMTLLEKDRFHPMETLQLYTIHEQTVVLNQYNKQGKIVPRPLSPGEGQSFEAVLTKLSSAGATKEMVLWGSKGVEGTPETANLDDMLISISYGSDYKELPFELKLDDFIVERYPGSQSPSSFESYVTLLDKAENIAEPRHIYMNNVLKYKGYRFYQSSYDPDEKGSILSVNYDRAGTRVTYAGYLLMALGMLLSLFNKNSRFRALAAETNALKLARKGAIMAVFLGILTGPSKAQESEPISSVVTVDKTHAARFGRLLIQDNGGRIEPVNTLSSEVLRKLYRQNDYKGMTPDQVFLGMFTDPAAWQFEPLIRTTHPRVQEMLGSKGMRYYSFASFFRDNHYILADVVEKAFRKKPVYRSKFDNEIIRLDERVNIAYMVFTGEILRILPVPGDSTQTWYSQAGISGKVHTADSVFTNHILTYYIGDVQQSLKTGKWESPGEIVDAISNFQHKFGKSILPPPAKVKLEILLNKADVFSRIAKYYGMVGFILLMLQFIGLFFKGLKLKVPVIISIILIITLFLIQTIGLGVRWYVSGHAPWSNGYEALIYIAWASVLAGLVFANRSSITLSATSILAFLILNTAHLSWMDPQITNLVPVLKSYWLVIHVATITASYGFLALGALLAFINLLLMILLTSKNREYLYLTVRELTHTIEMTLIIGLYLLTVGCFLGAVWANEAWGRYWGWDPKETWALISILIYAFILHMRMIPGLRGVYALNLASLLGIGTILMTYFGVNYYLSGLHSYAQGDPLRVPLFVYYSLAVVVLVALGAYFRYRRLNREA